MAKSRKIFMFSVVALLILSVAMAFSILDQGNNERNDTVSVIVDNSNSRSKSERRRDCRLYAGNLS